jgi:hypothetical protein
MYYLMLLACVLGQERTQQRLKPDAVPSVFAWSQPKTDAAIARQQRAERRSEAYSAETMGCQVDQEQLIFFEEVVEEVVSFSPSSIAPTVEEIVSPFWKSTGTQTENESETETIQPHKAHAFLSYENITTDSELLHYYTGLESPSKLITVFHTLGPAVNHLNYYNAAVVKIPPIDQFILMLTKLRQALDYLPLSKMLGISTATARNIFITWINFCSRQWGEIQMWPDRALVRYYAPDDFMSKFPSMRVIIDGTEMPIQKPKDPLAQRSTFSSYKNRNTVKVVVGVSPGGLITYLSPAYGGSASDRQIVERSGLVYMCDPKDSIMADKGFNVQDLFAMNDVTVNIPAFFKNKIECLGSKLCQTGKLLASVFTSSVL